MSALTEKHEYIVTAIGPRISLCSEPVICGPLGERVIRCRDCGFYDQTIHSCGRIDVAYKAFVSYVFDDGFCSWAEPKEEW